MLKKKEWWGGKKEREKEKETSRKQSSHQGAMAKKLYTCPDPKISQNFQTPTSSSALKSCWFCKFHFSMATEVNEERFKSRSPTLHWKKKPETLESDTLGSAPAH